MALKLNLSWLFSSLISYSPKYYKDKIILHKAFLHGRNLTFYKCQGWKLRNFQKKKNKEIEENNN